MQYCQLGGKNLYGGSDIRQLPDENFRDAHSLERRALYQYILKNPFIYTILIVDQTAFAGYSGEAKIRLLRYFVKKIWSEQEFFKCISLYI